MTLESLESFFECLVLLEIFFLLKKEVNFFEFLQSQIFQLLFEFEFVLDFNSLTSDTFGSSAGAHQLGIMPSGTTYLSILG